MNKVAENALSRAAIYCSISTNKTGAQIIQEMPQYYPGKISYQKDSKFIPISMRNFQGYTILGEDAEFIFAIDSHGTTGFVFSKMDIKRAPRSGVIPVLRVALRDSEILGLKQAHALRIRASYSQKGIATAWYMLYVEKYGGIVSDFEHLEGGKRLWKSFIDTAVDRGLKVSTYNLDNNKETPVGPETPEAEIWSKDQALHNQLLVLQK